MSNNPIPMDEANINLLCENCASICITDDKTLQHLPNLRALEDSASSGCHLCNLMLSGLRHSSTDLEQGIIPSDEVTVTLGSIEDAFLMLALVIRCADRQTKLWAIYDDKNLNEADIISRQWRKSEEAIQSSLIDIDPQSDTVFSKIQNWLQNCHENHRSCNDTSPSKPQPLPTRVIDVGPSDGSKEPHLLVTDNLIGDYITLSHCWGAAVLLTTTKSTYQNRLDEIEISTLPANFQDAVLITRKLGKRYIWIDSLCIIQDSAQDWEQESAQMGAYYGNAWLTLCADGARDSRGGMLKRRNLLEVRMCKHPHLIRMEDLDDTEWNIYYPIGSFKSIVHEGILSRRAWILQERVLSGRMLHWGQNELFWECAELQASERRPRGVTQNLWDGQRLTRLLRSAQCQTSSEEGTDSIEVFNHFSFTTDEIDDFWYELLEDYCKRQLTVADDKLPAMSGLAKSFQRLLIYKNPLEDRRYVAGLWVPHLPIALGWAGVYESIFPKNKPGITYIPQHRNVTSYRAPSFSWASIEGPIEHRYRNRSKAEKTIEGSEAEVLEIQITPAGSNPFGRVLSAQLTLRGFMKPFINIPHNTALYLDGISRIYNDEELKAFENLWCFCLGFMTHNSKSGDKHLFSYCIALEMVDCKDGIYRRVGLLETVLSNWFIGSMKTTIKLV